jgi:hypothetical protein
MRPLSIYCSAYPYPPKFRCLLPSRHLSPPIISPPYRQPATLQLHGKNRNEASRPLPGLYKPRSRTHRFTLLLRYPPRGSNFGELKHMNS